jgi:hypothetical protein
MISLVLRTIRGWFVTKPSNKLSWSKEDFKLGRRWAKSQPHSIDKNKTLWDEVYQKRSDSTWTLHELNKRL